MRYSQNKCLNFLQNDRKKSNSGRIPIYVGDKANCKESFREVGETKHMSPPSVKHPIKNGKRKPDTSLPEEESVVSKDNIEHDIVHDVNFSEEKATKQTYTYSEDKLVKTKLENGKHFKTTSQTTNKDKGSMIPTSTLRSRKGSKKRAAALVDELSKSVDDLSHTKPTSSKLDRIRLTRASKFSKSCDHLDNNANLEEEFAQGNSEDNIEDVSLKADYNKIDKLLIGTRKSRKKEKDVITAMDNVSKIMETEGRRYSNDEKEVRAAINDEKSKPKHPIITNKDRNADEHMTHSHPVKHDNQFITEHKSNDVRNTSSSERAVIKASGINENRSNTDNSRSSIQGEQRKTQNDSQSPRDKKKTTEKTSRKGFKLSNELSEHEHRIVAEESDAIISEIKLKKKIGRKREDIPITAKKVDMLSEHEHRIVTEESDAIISEIKLKNKIGRKREDIPITAKKVDMGKQEQDPSSDRSVGGNRFAENQDNSSLNEKTYHKKSIGGTEIKKQNAPMIYNEVKMNTINKKLLSKSLEDMVALNEAWSTRGNYNTEKGGDISATEEGRNNDGNYDQHDISTTFLNRERRKLYPKLNLSLNFDDSHQSSPLDSSPGYLEMSSGLEANTARSNYNFHISLDESQELSQSVNLIKDKIFNGKDEWDASQTSARVLKNENDESEGKSPLTNLLSRRNFNRNQAMEITTEETHKKLDNFIHKDTQLNDDDLSQSFNSVNSDNQSTRNGASSSCSLLYNKDMGLICKKCFASSCYHMEQVDQLETLTTEIAASKENKPTLLSKHQESVKLSEIDESKPPFNKYRGNILGYEHRRAARNSNFPNTSNIRNISNTNTKNVHVSMATANDYNIYSNSTNRGKSPDRVQTTMNNSKRDTNPVPFSRQNKINYPVEFLEKYNPELCYNNTPSFDSSVENDNHDVDYLSSKIQDNRRTLNHLLRTTPMSNISQDEDIEGTPRPTAPVVPVTPSTNEPETPKTRRSNSIIAASDLETVFEVDERATPLTPKLSTGKSPYVQGSKIDPIFERPLSEDSDGEHVPSPVLPQYDKKDQILQLLDQARSILNLKKRKTSQDCLINTNRIYVKNMMKANSAISSSTMSPKKKPKTATPPDHSHSILHTEDIEKSKSAPGFIDLRTRNTRTPSDYEGNIPNQKIEKKDYVASDESLDVPLNLDFWVNVSSNSSVEEPPRDKNNFKPTNVFALNSTESEKHHASSQNCTPSPGDSGIEIHSSNLNSYNSTVIDSKRDVKTLNKRLLSNSGVYTEASMASTQQCDPNFSFLDPRTLHIIKPTRDRYKDATIHQRHLSDRTNIDNGDRYKNSTIHQRYLSDRTSIESGGIRRPYKPPLFSSSTASVPTMPRKTFPQLYSSNHTFEVHSSPPNSSGRASDVTELPSYTQQGAFTESDTWTRSYYENSTKNKGDTSQNQRSNPYIPATAPYLRQYSKSLPSPPSHDRYSTVNMPLQGQNSYRLSNHIISASINQPLNRSERSLSIGNQRRDFIDYSTTNNNLSNYRTKCI